jgi:integrase
MATRHSILGGKVQLFQRPRSPFWQSTATVGGAQHMKSTGQESLALAKDVAEGWYLDLKGRARWGDGLPRQKKRRDGVLFRDAASVFLEEFETLIGAERSPKYIEVLRHKIDKYLIPFFEGKYVDEIDENMVVAYRIERTKAKDKDGNPKPPARTTIHHEIIALRHVLKTCKRKRWLKAVPDLSAPYKASGKIAHRAWFSVEEYQRLYRATRKRAKHPPHPKWKWECEQFHDYVLFMANTGLRPDEAARLEFRDVVIVDDDATGERIVEIDVRGKRGVGFCKSMPGAVRPFERLRDREREIIDKLPSAPVERKGLSRGGTKQVKKAKPGPTDLIFGPTQREMMNAVLDELGLKLDREGQRRTAYSLRHTYICFRLMEGADIYQIAKNCRTSVEMIEKYYASHIKNLLDASAINVRKLKGESAKQVGALTADDEG